MNIDEEEWEEEQAIEGIYQDIWEELKMEEIHTDNTKTLQNALDRIEELEEEIEKMRCCQNCKYNSYWGNELHCNYGLKEALQEDKLVECDKMDKWEIKEK